MRLPNAIPEGARRDSCMNIGIAQESGVNHQGSLNIDALFQTPLSNNPWEVHYVLADEVELPNSKWSQVASTPGIYVFGQTFNGCYGVIIDESYMPWLRRHNFRFLDKADFAPAFHEGPRQPTTSEEEEYGVVEARRIIHLPFFENVFKAIWSRRSAGLESYLRSITPPDLQPAFEWMILSRDILGFQTLVRKKFTICLVLLTLLLKDHDDPMVIQLLEKDEDGLLQAFGKDPDDLLQAESVESLNCNDGIQTIGLLRRLFMVVDGPLDSCGLQFDQEYTPINNLNLLGSLVGVTGTKCSRSLDWQQILVALSKSKAISDEDVENLNIPRLIYRMTTFLPIGFHSGLSLTTKEPVFRYKLCIPQSLTSAEQSQPAYWIA